MSFYRSTSTAPTHTAEIALAGYERQHSTGFFSLPMEIRDKLAQLDSCLEFLEKFSKVCLNFFFSFSYKDIYPVFKLFGKFLASMVVLDERFELSMEEAALQSVLQPTHRSFRTMATTVIDTNGDLLSK